MRLGRRRRSRIELCHISKSHGHQTPVDWAASRAGRPVTSSVFIRARSASRPFLGSTANAVATPWPNHPPGGLYDILICTRVRPSSIGSKWTSLLRFQLLLREISSGCAGCVSAEVLRCVHLPAPTSTLGVEEVDQSIQRRFPIPSALFRDPTAWLCPATECQFEALCLHFLWIAHGGIVVAAYERHQDLCESLS
jgi:hypothetical protein